MKLFLASASNTLPLIASKLLGNGKGGKVIFIENASDNYSGDKWWIKADRDTFVTMGCDVVDVDLRKTDKEAFAMHLKDAAVIHFCGGSVLYLISLIRSQDLGETLIEVVKRGKILYSGTSAGSMIPSNDLGLLAFDDEDAEYAKKMTDFSGLGLVGFLTVPHTNNKDFAKSNIRMIEHLHENLQPLIFIDDTRAVWVEDGKLEILSV